MFWVAAKKQKLRNQVDIIKLSYIKKTIRKENDPAFH